MSRYSRYIESSNRERLRTGLRRDTGQSLLDQDHRPGDLIEVEEAQARPDSTSYGPSVPFGPSDVSPVSYVETLEEQLELDITSLLLTNPGEAIGDPKFGVGARQFLFDSEVGSSIDGGLISRIELQMERYYPAVKILNLRVFTVDNIKYLEMIVSLGGTSISVTV